MVSEYSLFHYWVAFFLVNSETIANYILEELTNLIGVFNAVLRNSVRFGRNFQIFRTGPL